MTSRVRKQMEQEASVLWTVDGPVATLTLNRPQALNALTVEMLARMEDLLTVAEADPDIRVLVIAGSGEKAFCVGADLKARAEEDVGGVSADPLGVGVRRVFGHIEALPKPVVAALHGYTLGGGLELALACDLRVAADNAKLGFPEAKVGSMPGAGGTQRLTRLVGPAVAKELMFTGVYVGAEEAARLGLVNHVWPAAEFPAQIGALTASLADRAPLSIAAIKAAVNLAGDVGLPAGLAFESMNHAVLRHSLDRQEGIRAFAEKRPPRFVGR